MTERQFQPQVVQLARLCGWLIYHTFDSRRSAAGFPDLCMVRGDRCLFVELKSDRLAVAYSLDPHDEWQVEEQAQPEAEGEIPY